MVASWPSVGIDTGLGRCGHRLVGMEQSESAGTYDLESSAAPDPVPADGPAQAPESCSHVSPGAQGGNLCWAGFLGARAGGKIAGGTSLLAADDT